MQDEATDLLDTADAFFHACESGEGWEASKPYCHPDASFSAQAAPLRDIDTVEAYTGWMQAQYKAMPDIEYEITSLAVDEERGTVSVCAVLRGTHTGAGGPVPPTGQRVESEYAYRMDFRDGAIDHVTKIWNAPHAMKQLGWG
ncbi:MAG: nuclear transport factor 2 family protein [Bacteroidetes bacterium]|nr:nuclear transport factor 2 family protein [Bacteroidota bacterium]